ncbi:hypothetical protein [uncultured Erythrobacter sp.]|uniref:hypothetical protein n=1 Tax=uncultured Erythrobacter sp. TaxID=263913 RepID=UPI002604E9ED|nr:hypothetical protein [uncultured Erythrobacter sp.]
MSDSTHESDRILGAAKQSLLTQQSGGTHRPAKSIGQGSANVKLKTWLKRAGYFGAALLAIMASASVIGAIIGGIGFWGIIMTLFAVGIAAGIFMRYPTVNIPKRHELKQGNPKQMVARTELWLENQRSALPPAAASIVEQLGGQLDALGAQLATMDETHPAMSEVRDLVGEYIPETIDNYRKIPEHLRKEEHAGSTADERLIESLTKLSGEVDRVTRRLAEGAMDDLAVKSRYLDYRFGGDDLIADMTGSPDTGVPLPELDVVPATKKEAG